MLNGPRKKATVTGNWLAELLVLNHRPWGAQGGNPICGQAQGICSEQMHENLVKTVGFHLPRGGTCSREAVADCNLKPF